MLSHEMEKMLNLANERRAALLQEAAAVRLLGQQEQGNQRWVIWQQALRRWWRRLAFVRPTYSSTGRPLVEL